jgi:Arc/MetJ family transcription regulator
LVRLPSRTRRAVYLIDAARAHSLRKNNLAVVHLLRNTLREPTDTVRYNRFAEELRGTGRQVVGGDGGG